MKCFTICFHTLKHRKTQKPKTRTALKDLIHEDCEVLQDIKQPRDEMQPAELIKTIADSKDEIENQLNTSSRKKVTFDFDVKANEECKTQEAAECLVENGKRKDESHETDTLSDSVTSSSGFISFPISDRYHNCSKSEGECEEIQLNESDLDCVESGFVEEESSESLFSISLDSKKQVVSAAEMGNKEVNSPLKPRVRDVKANEECKTQEAAECLVENGKRKDETDTLSDSVTSSSGFISFPISDRYHNCSKSEGECEEIQLNESDLDSVESGFVEEESSESLFSISLDSKKQVVSAAEMGDKEVNSPLKPRVRDMKSKELNIIASNKSEYVHSVLNPVKNLSELKAVKAKAASVQNEGKENINFDQEIVIPFSAEPNFKQIVKKQVCDQRKVKENEAAADTSLSSWLAKNSPGSVCNSSESTMSSKRVQERSILGALNVDPIKELSKSTSSRQSPGQSQDDAPIIGTVGSYWRHAGRRVAGSSSGSSSACRGDSGITSKCIEMGEVTSQSTPFQTRLEKALTSVV